MGRIGLTNNNETQASITSYEDHPSMSQINDVRNSSNFETDKVFSFNLVSATEIKQLLETFINKKAAGIGSIPPKLTKLESILFSKSLTESINFCIQHSAIS